jgi:hypothetical protein
VWVTAFRYTSRLYYRRSTDNPAFTGVARVRIVRAVPDCDGTAFVGTAVSEDLRRYLRAHECAGQGRVFFRDTDLASPTEPLPRPTQTNALHLSHSSGPARASRQRRNSL